MAIENMPVLKNMTILQAFLGLVNNYLVHILNIHKVKALLNELLKENIKWVWTEKCQKEFNELKDVLTSDLYFTHFDSKLEIILAKDASKYGLGAILLHKNNWQEKGHSSRSKNIIANGKALKPDWKRGIGYYI